MGGEDLKKYTCISILFAIGFFALTLNIPAQETDSASGEAALEVSPAPETAEEEPSSAGADRLREAEQAYPFARDNNPAMTGAGTSVWTIIRMILALALVAVSIYALVYFLKKKTSAKDTSKDPYLRVLASSHLGNNRYAQILSVGSRAWLVGSTDASVNLISEIEDKEIIDAMQLEDSKKTALAPRSGFLDFFSMLRRSGVKTEDGSSSADEIRKRREKLKEM